MHNRNSETGTDHLPRKGFCCDCANIPDGSIVVASKVKGHPCNGCWFTESKQNWAPAPEEKGDEE